MATIIGIHGIAQQVKGESVLHDEWFAPMADGVRFAGGGLTPMQLSCVSYGQLFRTPGRALSAHSFRPRLNDAITAFDEELLMLWWTEAARVDEQVIAPNARTLARTPRSVQAALRALTGSRFFAGITWQALISDLNQVRRYFSEPDLREHIRLQVARHVNADTRVLVGHSLGSVIAYEALCENPDWPVSTLVTLGSPLGIRKLIFERLTPPPRESSYGKRLGVWPGSVRNWTNIAGEGDVVALVKDLTPYFGPAIRGYIVDTDAKAHAVAPYLTTPEAGAAIMYGLSN